MNDNRDFNIGDYNVSMRVSVDGNLFVEFDRLDNMPDKAEPLCVIINDTLVFNGIESPELSDGYGHRINPV